MKTKTKLTIIGITSAFLITAGIGFGIVKYLDNILNTPQVHAEAVPTVEEVKAQQDATNDFELTHFNFDFQSYNSINGQKVMYNGELTSVALLPQADRVKAIDSAISTPEEAAKVLRYVHNKFNEILASYNKGTHDEEYYLLGEDGITTTLMPSTLYDERLTNNPEVYLRLAELIGNDKAAQDLRDVASLVEIAVANKDVQGFLYAHRVIHDVDSFVINRPDEGEEPYGAARAMKNVKASKLAEITSYIKKNEGREG